MTTATNTGELLAMCREDIPNLRRQGSKWRGSCPFHPDHDPSFYVGVHQGREFFKCFGADCGKSGGVITYRRLTGRRINGPSVRTRNNVIIEERPYDVAPPPPSAVRDANQYFQATLPDHPRAVNYLNSRRVPADRFGQFGIGYCPRDKGLFAYMTQQGYQENDLVRWRLVLPKSKNAIHGGRVTIAHRTPHLPKQDQTWYTARLITSGGPAPRYLNPTGPRPPLLSPPKPTGTVVLVEGAFDMLIMRTLGIRAAAVNGEPDDEYFARALQSTGYPSVMALPDRDAGGRGWLDHVRAAAESVNLPFMALELPPLYADPAQLAQGPDPRGEIRRIISDAKRKRTATEGAERETGGEQGRGGDR